MRRMMALLLLLCVGGPFDSQLALLAQDKQDGQNGATVDGKSPQRPLVIEGASPDQKKCLADFQIADREFNWKLTRTREKEKWVEYELTFASPVTTANPENNTVPCKYWVPKDDQVRRPAAVALHWLGGSFDILEVVCQKLAEQGVSTLMLWMPGYGKRRAKDRERRENMINGSMERTLANFRQAVLDVRRAGDWLASRPDVDPSRVGLFGISLGSIVGCLAAGIDLNFRRTALIIGGGDMPGLVWHDSKETKEIKRKLEEAGFTREKLAELWRGIEPLTYASRLERSSVLMVNAESDQVFPRACTEKLWEAIGKPELLWYKADHFTIVLHFPKIFEKIAEHLKVRSDY